MNGEPAPLLELRQLKKSFGGLRVVDELSLDVRAGEIVSLIGPNGAGKTTVFNLVTGVYAPDGGEISSRVGASPACPRTRSRRWGSRAPSRRSGCSST